MARATYVARVCRYNPEEDDHGDFKESLPLEGDIGGPHVLRNPVLFSEALLAHDVYVCLEHPSGALPPESAI